MRPTEKMLAEEARQLGYVVAKITSKARIKYVHRKTRKTVFVSPFSGDHRAAKNALAALKRCAQ